MTSCLTDIPLKESQSINPDIYTPPVFNYKSVDSLLTTFNIDTIRSEIRSSYSYQVFNIVSSNYHLGFTDLTKYDSIWYVSMRVSEGHIPTKIGCALLLKSKDLKKWEQEQVFIQEGFDIRDPKLLIADSTLYVHFNSTTINPYGEVRNDYISKYNPKSQLWEKAVKIEKTPNLKSWFWRITYDKETFYTTGYLNGKLKLYESKNAINFNELHYFNLSAYLTEATLRFFENKAYILIRVSNNETLFGVADENDLTEWTFNPIPIIEIGGPNFVFLNGDNILISGRNINKTGLYYYNISSNKLKELKFMLSSGADTGYPGMYLDNDILYMLYYSADIPFSKSVINLAVIDLNKTDLFFD